MDNKKTTPTKNNTYRTSSLNLAAALKQKKFEFLEVRLNQEGRAVFSFVDREDREQIVKSYYDNTLTGVLKEYVQIWGDFRELIRQVKE